MHLTVRQLLALAVYSGALFSDSCALILRPPRQLTVVTTSRGIQLLLMASNGDDERNEKGLDGWNSAVNKPEETTKSKKPSPIGEPQIFSKQALFGNEYNAVTVSAVDEEFSAAAIGQRNLPKGIERLQPSELVKKTSVNNDGANNGTEADEYEIVDKFRFKIDADTLRNAILQKQSLNARQELLSSVGSDVVPLSKQEVSFDAAFLEKLTSSGTLDESGDSTILRVQLDYDEFESMVHTSQLAEQEQGDEEENQSTLDDNDIAALFGPNPVFVDRQMRRDRKKSLQYSSSRMDEAERFLAQSSSSSPSSSFEAMIDDERKDRTGSEQAYPSDRANFGMSAILTPASSSLQSNNSLFMESLLQPITSRKVGILNILGLTVKSVIASAMTAVQQPNGGLYWTDVSPSVLSDSVYGTAVVGFSLASAILLLDKMCQWFVRSIILSFNLVVDNLPWIPPHQKLAVKRGSKPVIFVAVVLVRLLWMWRDRYVRNNRFKGIGYQVHDKF